MKSNIDINSQLLSKSGVHNHMLSRLKREIAVQLYQREDEDYSPSNQAYYTSNKEVKTCPKAGKSYLICYLHVAPPDVFTL